jgi:hypothetical protein
MPVLMTLEGPKVRQPPQLMGFWDDLQDRVAEAASSVAHIFYAQAKPKPKRSSGVKGLFGVLDPVKAHPLILVLGIGAGIFLAARKKR